MRYLLSPDEERRFLRHLKTEFKLTPLAPPDSGEFPGNLEARADAILAPQSPAEPHEYVFWASDYGPIRRLGERIDPEDAVGRAMLKINRDAGADGRAVDLERTRIVSWSRTRWFDEKPTLDRSEPLGRHTRSLQEPLSGVPQDVWVH